MALFYISLIIINIIIGTLPLVFTNKSKMTLSFFINSIIITGWTASNFMIFNSDHFFFWNQLAYLFSTLFAASSLYFSLYFPQTEKKLSNWRHLIIIIPTCLQSILVFTPYHIISMKSPLQITFGSLDYIWTLYFLIYVTAIIVISIKNIKRYKKEKTTIKIYIFGFISFIITGLLFNQVLPTLYEETSFYRIGPITSVLYNFTLAYLILKHRLFNINLLVNKIIANILSFFIILFGFNFITFIYKFYISNELDNSYLTSITIYFLIAAYFFNGFRIKLQSTTEKLFLSGKYNYQKIILDYSQATNIFNNLNQLIEETYQTLENKCEMGPIEIYIPEWFDRFKETSTKLSYIQKPQSGEPVQKQNPCSKELITFIKKEKIRLLEKDKFQALFATNNNSIILCSFNNDGNIIAMICIGKKMTEDSFTTQDIQLLKTLNTQLEVSLLRIKSLRLSTEMEFAQKLQEEIIPKQTRIKNCSISTFLRSSDEIGGDFFDIHTKNDNHWIILGDVTGHGLGSGMVMIMIQSIFSTLIHSFNIENPAEINKHANKILCQNFERLSEPRPISLINLQTRDGKTFNIHGNQENIIWYNQKENSVITYPLNHLPLGIGLTTDLTTDCFKDETITLNSGDILMLATDGLTEAYKNGKPENEQFNEKRLIKILEENKNKNPEEIKETIIQEIDQFTENTYLDDLTFIIIKKH